MNYIKLLILASFLIGFTTTGCEKKDKDILKDPVENKDPSGDDDDDKLDEDDDNNPSNGNDNDGDGNGDDDDDGPYIDYPYISKIGLLIFDGHDPITDGDPVFSFSDQVDVALNPGRSCQMSIKQYKDMSEGDVSGYWGLNLRTTIPGVFTDNKCFSQPMEIDASDFEVSVTKSDWYVELFPPDGSPYKILYSQDGDVKLYRDISTTKWKGAQGSIKVHPSVATYTDPNYGVQPKKVTFDFNNVRVGYTDKNNEKKAVRLVGLIEITKQD